MPRKRQKKKLKSTERVWYEIEVNDWEVGYTFGINDALWDLAPGDFWEHLHIDLIGKIIRPTLKNASAAKVILIPTWKLDDYYKNVHREEKPTTTGMIDLPRGSDILEFHCYLPSRLFGCPVCCCCCWQNKICLNSWDQALVSERGYQGSSSRDQ